MIRLPQELKEKVLEMPEYRQGVNKIRVRLKNGEIISDVYVAWGEEIIKVGDTTEIPFREADIDDVENAV